MSEIVTQKSVTYRNFSTPAEITTRPLDLATCYNENEIVIKLEAAALNPVDVLLHGLYPRYLLSQEPKTYAMDFAGTVVKKGSKVDASKWSVGTKVNGMFRHIYGDRGSLSNYLILDPVKSGSVLPMGEIPQDLLSEKCNEFEVSAAWPLVFGTAFCALFRQGQCLGPQSKVLVIGASTSVSNCFIQIAKNHLHIGTVVGICSSKSMEFNKSQGYHYLVAYDDPERSTVEQVKQLIAGELSGEKFDLIFDSVGNSDFKPTIDDFLKPVSANSQYVTIAGDAKMNYSNPSFMSFLPSKYRLMSLTPWKKFNYVPLMLDPSLDWMELGAKMLQQGQFKPLIDSVYSFKDFQSAMDKLKSNKCKGKVVIKINPDDVDE